MPAFVFTSLLAIDVRGEEPLRIATFALGLAALMLTSAYRISGVTAFRSRSWRAGSRDSSSARCSSPCSSSR
jgi:hypothetical protein